MLGPLGAHFFWCQQFQTIGILLSRLPGAILASLWATLGTFSESPGAMLGPHGVHFGGHPFSKTDMLASNFLEPSWRHVGAISAYFWNIVGPLSGPLSGSSGATWGSFWGQCSWVKAYFRPGSNAPGGGDTFTKEQCCLRGLQGVYPPQGRVYPPQGTMLLVKA
jgi:hypothetical protein